MERLAARLGLDGSVRFRGRLPHGPAVAAFLDETDLFVLPSRAEGMPRALVEAMARGCPCVASRVGGVAELLPPGALVTPGDAEALAQRLLEVLSGAGELAAAVERNYRVALRYRPEVLAPLRRQFLEDYRRVAEAAADGR
jgi:glycosyltransferase involved in cell wall biosynthesis